MPKIIFLTLSGDRLEVEGEVGYNVMEVAIANGVEGILGECGGACACATCHGYIDPEWLHKLEPIDDMEDTMLEMVNARTSSSRLTCQIELSEELDGLIVRVADNQY